MTWIDITTPLREGMPVYPGDPPVRLGLAMSMAAGDPADVTTIATGLHAGTHIDAPAHVIAGGAGVEGADPDALIGDCAVVAAGGGPLGAREVRALLPDGAPARVLLRTGHGCGWPPHDGPGLTPDGARAAVDRGVVLMGIDTMSVAGGEGAIEAHRILLSAGVVV
ncbi:MAG: cyclase family protein, partial [Miltoncostaeaceae bacterium]